MARTCRKSSGRWSNSAQDFMPAAWQQKASPLKKKCHTYHFISFRVPFTVKRITAICHELPRGSSAAQPQGDAMPGNVRANLSSFRLHNRVDILVHREGTAPCFPRVCAWSIVRKC
eukprot:1791579-Rhodomonas_salina.1